MGAPTKPTPATSEEQRAMLGNVRRIPRDVDMFTGEVVTKPPKRGNGSHIQLKSTGLEKTVVPGMASYAGEGPHGKRCEQCRWFGRVKVVRPDRDTIETCVDACLRAAQLTGRIPMARQQIKHCQACRFFAENDGGRHEWCIFEDGVTREILGTSPKGDVLGNEVGRPGPDPISDRIAKDEEG